MIDEQLLELLKELLGVKGNLNYDTILNFYLTKSKNAVVNYLNIELKEYNEMDLSNQTIELALYYYNNRKQTGMKQYSEGTKHKSYEEGGIPESIKATLPLPRIILM